MLFSKNPSRFFCDQCKYFLDRKNGLTGRKPSKNAIPKCEKPWFFKIHDGSETRLILEKRKAIENLRKKGYTVNDDNYNVTSFSKLYSSPLHINKPKSKSESCKKFTEKRPRNFTSSSPCNINKKSK